MKKTAYLLLLPAAILIVLGGLNVYKKATWTEPFDGVIWDNRPEGLTAIRVEEDSPAYLAGIERGDVLFKINDNPVNHKIDVVKNLWIAEGQNQIVKYEISKKGMLVFPALNYISRKGTNILYFFLVLIGLTALVIALILFFNLT